MQTVEKILYIEAIERCENMTKASIELFVSQPYLSKVIKRIESDSGIQIFNYEHHKMSLTYSGKRYLWYLKEINSIENKMNHEFYLIKTNQKGEITFGINPALASTFLAQVVPRFHKDFPDISIKLSEQNQNISERMISSGEMDLAFGMGPLQYDKEVSSSSIFKEELYLLVSEKSQLFDPQKLNAITKFNKDISLIQEEPVILTPIEYGIGKVVSHFFIKNNMTLKSIITTSTVPTAINLAMSGMGLTFVPKILIDKYVQSEKCMIYSVNKQDLFADYILIFSKNSSMNEISLKLYTSFVNILSNS